MHCCRMLSKIFSAMLWSRNRLTRLALIVAWSGPFSVSFSPRNHLNAIFSLTSCASFVSDLIPYKYPRNSMRNSTSGSIAGLPMLGEYRSLHKSWIKLKSTAPSILRSMWSCGTSSSSSTISYSFCLLVSLSRSMCFSSFVLCLYSTPLLHFPFGFATKKQTPVSHESLLMVWPIRKDGSAHQ